MNRKLENKGCIFKKWQNTHFFSAMHDKTVHLICSKGVAVPKKYNLYHLYKTLHKDKFGVLKVKLKGNKLKDLKSDLQQKQNTFTVATEAKVPASSFTTKKKSKPLSG
jgi:hypothetical protein